MRPVAPVTTKHAPNVHRSRDFMWNRRQLCLNHAWKSTPEFDPHPALGRNGVTETEFGLNLPNDEKKRLDKRDAAGRLRHTKSRTKKVSNNPQRGLSLAGEVSLTRGGELR